MRRPCGPVTRLITDYIQIRKYLVFYLRNEKTKGGDKTTIQIPDEIRQRLKLIAAYRGMTYKDILDEFTKNELRKFKLSEPEKNNSKK